MATHGQSTMSLWPRAGPGPTLARPSWPRVKLARGHGPAGLTRPSRARAKGQ
jgi:hypothetical protein